MVLWWNKRLEMSGGVLFRGDLPLQPHDFAYLERQNISIKAPSGNTNDKWSLELAHPEWGNATLEYNHDVPIPPREIYMFSHLSDSNKDAAISARIMLGLRMQSKHGHILRDRKLMLRFLRAVMGDDGVIVVDFLSENVWSREQMDDELSHDADLDISGIFQMQAINEHDDKVYWIHTHGLTEIGEFDFDIIEPSEDVMFGLQDLSRSIAFQIMEGTLKRSMPEFILIGPNYKASLVPMSEFLAGTSSEIKAKMKELVNENHLYNRSVICDPKKSSFIGSLFGGNSSVYRPSHLLSGKVPDNPMLVFSHNATALMAERAMKTYPVLKNFRQEFAEFEFPCLIKIGLQVDGGGKNDREHMWFEPHDLQNDTVDATLCNQPYYIKRLKEGDRGRYDVSSISDWTIFTPLGSISPCSISVARAIRENKEEIRQMMKQAERK